MKNTFDVRRFFRLFANDYLLNYKKYILLLIVLIALTSITFIISALIKKTIHTNSIIVFSIFGLMISQGLYTVMAWGEFSSKTKTTFLLTLPAHKSEIFIQRLISCFIIFPLFYCLYTWLVLSLTIEYNWIIEQYNNPGFVVPETARNVLTGFFHQKESYLVLVFVWIAIASAYFWGAIRYKKYVFLKSVAFWFVSIFSLWPVSIILRLILTGKYNFKIVPFLGYLNKNEDFFITEVWPHYYIYLLLFVSLSLIFISYIKFKEKTI